jgi:hypothetical protein
MQIICILILHHPEFHIVNLKNNLYTSLKNSLSGCIRNALSILH